MSRPSHRALRKLRPDDQLLRRRAAGASLRELAPEAGVSHQALSAFFRRPEVLERMRRLRDSEHREATRSSQAFRGREAALGSGRSRYAPLELAPGSDEWLGWYEARRLRSQIDLLNCNDARRGIVPPLERRARERARRRPW